MKRFRPYLLVPVFLYFCGSPSWSQTLSIYHIDVGQGDATLVVSPSGKSLLIDGGDTGKGISRVVPLLNSLKIRSLDYTVATHYDADHIGGLDEVIRALGARINLQAFDRGEVKRSTRAYRDYRDAVREKRNQIRPGDRIGMDSGLEIVCVAVNQEVLGGRKIDPPLTDENGNSVALLVRFKNFDYFIGGDLTGGGRSGNKRTPDVETLVAESIGDVDILRVSHHGSQTSSNQTFLNVLQPEVAVISVGDKGKNRRYRHPHRVVLTRLRNLPNLQVIFMTHRGETTGGLRREELERIKVANGNVVLTTDGESYSINGMVFPTDGAQSLIAGGSDGR